MPSPRQEPLAGLSVLDCGRSKVQADREGMSMKTAHKSAAASMVAAGLFLCAGSLWAQPVPAPTPPATPGATPAPAGDQVQATLRNEGGRRVYVASTVIDVRGEIQRPYAFSVSGRSSLGYTYFEQPVHFVQEILDAVRRAPFKP